MIITKVIGAVLIFLGLGFRAICVSYFKVREPHVPDTVQARRRFHAKRRNALLIDLAFFAAGLVVLLGR